MTELGDLAGDSRKTLAEFRAFLLRGNVVDLAVAVAVGTAFTAVIQAFVTDFITPLVGVLSPGSGELRNASFKIGEGSDRQAFLYGDFLDKALSFLIVAAVVFFFVVKPVNHLMARRKAKTDDESPKKDCPECLSAIPAQARRCAFCTAEQPTSAA